MGRAYRKDVTIAFGQILIPVNLTSAVSREESLSNVCCGVPGQPTHDTAGIRNNPACPVCGNQDATTWFKGRRDGEDWIVVDAGEVGQLKAEAIGGTKDLMRVGAHPVAEVRSRTANAKGCYQLSPSKEALRSYYSGIVDTIKRHPELAFLTLWSPTVQRTNLYEILVQDDALVMAERVRSENLVLEVQPLTPVGASEQQAIDSFVLPAMTSTFDPAVYADQFKAKLETLLASRQGQPGAVPAIGSTPSAAPATVDLSSLLASLATTGVPA